MTAPNDGHFPDPESLSPEERVQLIEELHEALHVSINERDRLVNVISAVANEILGPLSQFAREANGFGRRAVSLRVIAAWTQAAESEVWAQIGISDEDRALMRDFVDIVSQTETAEEPQRDSS